jgi:hypothetical protein
LPKLCTHYVHELLLPFSRQSKAQGQTRADHLRRGAVGHFARALQGGQQPGRGRLGANCAVDGADQTGHPGLVPGQLADRILYFQESNKYLYEYKLVSIILFSSYLQNSRARQKKYSGGGLSGSGRKLLGLTGDLCSSSNSNSSIGGNGMAGGGCRSSTGTPASSSSVGAQSPFEFGGNDSDNPNSGQQSSRKVFIGDSAPPSPASSQAGTMANGYGWDFGFVVIYLFIDFCQFKSCTPIGGFGVSEYCATAVG